MDKKKKVVKCDKCWREFEIEDNEEWGYCPFCENDQVELKRKAKEMLENEKRR